MAALQFLEEVHRRVGGGVVMGYAETLRAIGQALETLKIGDFHLEPYGEGYRITGGAVSENLRLARSERDRTLAVFPHDYGTTMELSYSLGDVERLDRDGRAQREMGHEITDTSRLSQALRVLGSYLNQKRSRMVRLSRQGKNFEVVYESSLGSRYSENLSAADLYDLWVRFYLQRSVRAS